MDGSEIARLATTAAATDVGGSPGIDLPMVGERNRETDLTEHSDHETGESNAGGLGQDISSAVARLGAGEKLAVLGAAGVVAVWLVFDLLLDEYPTGHLPFALALVATFAAYVHHNRGSESWSVDYKAVIFVTCGLTGVIGVWVLIEEVRAGILDDNAAEVIGAVLYYVAAITSGVGAWQLSRR